MRVDKLQPFLKENWLTIKQELLEGVYKPSPARRIETLKSDGNVRLLGILAVLYRLIQQAIEQEINKIYDSAFSESS